MIRRRDIDALEAQLTNLSGALDWHRRDLDRFKAAEFVALEARVAELESAVAVFAASLGINVNPGESSHD